MNDVIFESSKLEIEGETFETARLDGREVILATYNPETAPGHHLALRGEEMTRNLDSRGGKVRVCPADYDNMLAFERKVVPERRLVALNKGAGIRSGLGTGNRVIMAGADCAGLADPKSLGVFPGIYRALVKARRGGWFIQQSIVRELIPEGVDPADHPGLGHTGGYGPRELLRSGLFAFASLGGYARFPSPIGADADHAIVGGRDEEALAGSLELNKTALEEARDYTKFTVDTCNLFGFPVTLGEADQESLRETFRNRTFTIPNILKGHEEYLYAFSQEEALRLGRKYWRACRVHKELFDFVAGLKGDEPFDYELSLDETPQPTPPKELLFYLVVLEEIMGLPGGSVASVAPSFGFQKRTDYQGDLQGDLWPRVNASASIAASFDQVVCVHSGSGEGVTTGKGLGVDPTLAEATGGELQLKVSGIYQEILWRVLAGSPEPAERALFETAWERTRKITAVAAGDEGVGSTEAWIAQAVQGCGMQQTGLARELLPRAEAERKRPDDDFFRHFAYLVWSSLRAEIYGTVTAETWERYADAVETYTALRLRGLFG